MPRARPTRATRLESEDRRDVACGCDGRHTSRGAGVVDALVLWGADDPTFPEPRAREIADQFPNVAGFHAVRDAKLFLHEEHPAEVAGAIRRFLA